MTGWSAAGKETGSAGRWTCFMVYIVLWRRNRCGILGWCTNLMYPRFHFWFITYIRLTLNMSKSLEYCRRNNWFICNYDTLMAHKTVTTYCPLIGSLGGINFCALAIVIFDSECCDRHREPILLCNELATMRWCWWWNMTYFWIKRGRRWWVKWESAVSSLASIHPLFVATTTTLTKFNVDWTRDLFVRNTLL